MLRRLAIVPLSALLLSATPVKDSPARAMLNELAELEGRWEGNLIWSGARQGSGKIAATYTPAKFKGSVTEELFLDDKPYMTSVYHLDGTDLRVTHFCVESQPRLKADRFQADAGIAHFSLVDVTNAGPKSGFVEEISIDRQGSDSLTIEFVFKGNGPRAVETITLKRIA